MKPITSALGVTDFKLIIQGKIIPIILLNQLLFKSLRKSQWQTKNLTCIILLLMTYICNLLGTNIPISPEAEGHYVIQNCVVLILYK
jgi:hypothetical protein